MNINIGEAAIAAAVLLASLWFAYEFSRDHRPWFRSLLNRLLDLPDLTERYDRINRAREQMPAGWPAKRESTTLRDRAHDLDCGPLCPIHGDQRDTNRVDTA